MPRGPDGVIFLQGGFVLIEPQIKRAVAFVDGQNLFHAAKTAFGYIHPNYEFPALAKAVCQLKQWDLIGKPLGEFAAGIGSTLGNSAGRVPVPLL